MKTVAGIDLGTQSMKVVIYDYEKKEIIEKSSSLHTISDSLTLWLPTSITHSLHYSWLQQHLVVTNK